MPDKFVFPPCDVVIGEQRWFFDEKTMTLKDYFVLKAASGLTRPQFLNGLMADEPAALQALVWFVRRRDEPDLALADVDFLWDDLEIEDRSGAAESVPPPDVPGDDAPSPGTTPSSSGADGSTDSPATATSAEPTSTA